MQIIDLTPNREYLIGLALLEANDVDPNTILRRHAIKDDHVLAFSRWIRPRAIL